MAAAHSMNDLQRPIRTRFHGPTILRGVRCDGTDRRLAAVDRCGRISRDGSPLQKIGTASQQAQRRCIDWGRERYGHRRQSRPLLNPPRRQRFFIHGLRTSGTSPVSLGQRCISTIRAKDVSNPRAPSRRALADRRVLRADRCDWDHGKGMDLNVGISSILLISARSSVVRRLSRCIRIAAFGPRGAFHLRLQWAQDQSTDRG